MLTSIFGGFVSWKTTLSGLVAALAVFFKGLGLIDIPSDVQLAIVAVAVFVLGFFAKDSNQAGQPNGN